MPVDIVSTQVKLAEVYEITLTTGVLLLFTSHDVPLVLGDTQYTPLPIKRSSIDFKGNLQIDSVSMQMGIVGVTVGVNQYTIPQVIAKGWLKKAVIKIYVVNWPGPVTSKLLIFDGKISGGMSYDQGILSFECTNILDRLNEKLPKKLYTDLCQHTLYGLGTYACNLTKEDWFENGTAASGSTQTYILSTLFAYSAFEEDYWLDGELVFTSGENTDVFRTIKLHADGYIQTRVPFPFPVSTSDAFKAYPGCKKTSHICRSKFDNFSNFFGFEHIPPPDYLLGI